MGSEPTPRFIADAMLGGLARWLRILGLDVAYDPGLDDATLVEHAVREQRVILTRDRRLVQRKRARYHHLVAAEEVDEQVLEVLAAFAVTVEPGALLSRCTRCNTRLENLDPDVARERVPPYVARTQSRFRECPRCGRVYWRATHVERMRRRLEELGIRG